MVDYVNILGYVTGWEGETQNNKKAGCMREDLRGQVAEAVCMCVSK